MLEVYALKLVVENAFHYLHQTQMFSFSINSPVKTTAAFNACGRPLLPFPEEYLEFPSLIARELDGPLSSVIL